MVSVRIVMWPYLGCMPIFSTPELSFISFPHFLETPTTFSHGRRSQNLIFVSKHGGVMKWYRRKANALHRNYLTPQRSDRSEYKINRGKLSFCVHGESYSMFVLPPVSCCAVCIWSPSEQRRIPLSDTTSVPAVSGRY
jgi:hypothetical protein